MFFPILSISNRSMSVKGIVAIHRSESAKRSGSRSRIRSPSDGFDARRLLVAPLDECDAGEEVAVLDHDRHRVVDHVHPAELEHRPVVERGAFELPEPDRRHLCEAALYGAGEHRVGLHSVHDDDVVGLRGGLRVEDREPELRVSERHHVHPRVDRTAAEVLGDAKRREEIGLPLAVPPPWLPIAGTMNGAAPSPLK